MGSTKNSDSISLRNLSYKLILQVPIGLGTPVCCTVSTPLTVHAFFFSQLDSGLLKDKDCTLFTFAIHVEHSARQRLGVKEMLRHLLND